MLLSADMASQSSCLPPRNSGAQQVAEGVARLRVAPAAPEPAPAARLAVPHNWQVRYDPVRAADENSRGHSLLDGRVAAVLAGVMGSQWPFLVGWRSTYAVCAPCPPCRAPVRQRTGRTECDQWAPPRQATKSTVVERIAYLFNSAAMSDVRFVVGRDASRQVVPAHKFVLSIGSAVFDAMFNSSLSTEVR